MGRKVVQQLAEYIHTQNPTLKGWSKVTIYRMVSFYETYTSTAFKELLERLKLNKQLLPTLSAQIESKEIVSAQMTQIPSLLVKIGWGICRVCWRQIIHDIKTQNYITCKIIWL